MRTRARRIAVRVSEEQYNKICRLTERSFFTKEQVLRDIILGYPIQEDRKPVFICLFFACFGRKSTCRAVVWQ